MLQIGPDGLWTRFQIMKTVEQCSVFCFSQPVFLGCQYKFLPQSKPSHLFSWVNMAASWRVWKNYLNKAHALIYTWSTDMVMFLLRLRLSIIATASFQLPFPLRATLRCDGFLIIMRAVANPRHAVVQVVLVQLNPNILPPDLPPHVYASALDVLLHDWRALYFDCSLNQPFITVLRRPQFDCSPLCFLSISKDSGNRHVACSFSLQNPAWTARCKKAVFQILQGTTCCYDATFMLSQHPRV